MAVKHNQYPNGVESLGFVTGGQEATVGVIPKAGNYNFGVARRREVIRVLSGQITVRGCAWYTASTPTPLVFQVGEDIDFEALAGTSFLCLYE